jgi:tetratricopeptide (TPR) repeat protein
MKKSPMRNNIMTTFFNTYRALTISLTLALLIFIPKIAFTQYHNPALIINELLKSKQTSEAFEYFHKTIKIKPNNNEFFLAAGQLFMEDQQWDSSLFYFNKVKQNNPEKASFYLARLYAQIGNLAAMQTNLEIHLTSKYKKAGWEIKTDDAFNNIEHTKEWEKVWKKDWYNTNELALQEALYLSRINKPTEATEALFKLYKKRQSFYEAHAEYAHILSKNKEAKKAYPIIKQIVKKKNKEAYFYYIKSYTELELNKFKDALESIQQAINLDSTQLDFYLLKTKTLASTNHLEEAVDLGNFLAKISPSETTYSILAETYIADGNYLQALKQYNKALDLHAPSVDLYIERGKCYLKTQTWAFAERDFSFVMDFYPDNGELYYLRAMARLGDKRRENACSDLKKAYQKKHMPADKKLKQYCQDLH